MLFVHKDSHRFPFFPSSSPKSPPASLARRFEDALTARLAELLPLLESSPSLAFSWLASAVHLLALTLSDAADLLSGISASDRDTVAAYLDSGVALLDACNAASAEVDRILRRRLHLRFSLHLLSSSDDGRDTEKLKRALDSVAEWRASPCRAIKSSAVDLVRSLSPAALPRGKISAACRTIYAVKAVSFLVTGAVVAVLGGGGLAVPSVPRDLPWAEEYQKVATAVSRKRAGDGLVPEHKAAEAAVKFLTDVVDEIQANGDGQKAVSLWKAVDITEKATDKLTEGLDALSSAVNEVFHSALRLRCTALQGFRVGSQRCK
ncbi:protein BPS1, chloroplastic-like [Canna indica]|uniref:Protein BPS1, chloroplastic-like n=1 Tax=Canna indica TaxID=4628 RepID=A0AAQ3KQX1_9LILI|nr:protein BPS1, chloroplastic-like [Canna indica]